MNADLHAIYPLFVGMWVAAHFATNVRASRRTAVCYSTKVPLDDAIPFVPGFAFLYFSGFILGNTAYFLLGREDIFPRVALGYGIQFVTSISFYLLYPCRVYRNDNLHPKGVQESVLATFQRIAKPYNAFPSMHVSYGLFSALSVWTYASRGLGLAFIVWAVLVALSALLAKQHYIIDVIGGAALAALALYVSSAWGL